MITDFEEYNEKLGWKGALLGTGLALGGAIAADAIFNTGVADHIKSEVIADQQFKEYNLYAEGEDFTLILNGGFIVAEHSYEYEDDTKHLTNIIVPNGTKYIWFKTRFFGSTYAASKPFPDSHLIKISDLNKREETEFYIIYSGNLLSDFDYVVVLKDTKNMKGKEYKLSDKNIGIHVCHKVNKDLYIFAPKSIGEGEFGGSGASSEF